MNFEPKFSGSFEENKDNFPEFVYKFRSFKDENHLRLLSNRELYFAAPSSFEDPKDCKNIVRYDRLTYQEKMDWLSYKLKKEVHPKWSDEAISHRAREVAYNSPLFNESEMKEYQEQTEKRNDETLGILSLTGNYDNEHLWTEYADDFSGFCIEFHSILLFESLAPLVGGGKVVYQKELPIIHPEPYQSLDEQLHLQLYFKEEKWSGEDEYRLWTLSDDRFQTGSRAKQIQTNCFSRMILGKRSAWDEDQVRLMLCDDLKHIEIVNTNLK